MPLPKTSFSALSVLLSISILAACAKSESEYLHIGQPLSEARKNLIENGWAPIKTWPGIQRDEFGNYHASEIQTQIAFDNGFIEVEWCYPTGSASCKFNYKKNDKCFQLGTEGEFSDEYEKQHYEPHVVSWEFKCSEGTASNK